MLYLNNNYKKKNSIFTHVITLVCSFLENYLTVLKNIFYHIPHKLQMYYGSARKSLSICMFICPTYDREGATS